MNLTELTIRKNRTVFGLLTLMVITALLAYEDLPRDAIPAYKVRYAKIITEFPGASPQQVELLISDPIEKALQQITEIEDIISENRQGLSVVTVHLKGDVQDIHEVWTDIRHRMESVRTQLPENCIGPEVRDEYDDILGIIVGIEGTEGFTYNELYVMAERLQESFYKIPATSKVEIIGAQAERIFIDYNMVSLSTLGLTKTKLEELIASSNIMSSGGSVEVGNERVVLEPTGSFETLEDLRQLVLPAGGNEVILLGDLARVYHGYQDPKEHIVKINGNPALAVAVAIKHGENIVSLGEAIDEKAAQISEDFPLGIEVKRVVSLDKVIDQSFRDFSRLLLQSVLIILVFMIFFLGLRSGLVVSSMVPMTIFFTLVIMELAGLGLNQVSITSLIISQGMLVINSIVISESIQWRMQHGVPPVEACKRAVRELAVPLLIASLITAGAFVCFFLAPSFLGEIFGRMFIIVFIALIGSWLLSLIAIPIMVSLYVNVNVGPPLKKLRIENLRVRYRWSLEQVLKRPRPVIFSALLFASLSIAMMFFLPFRFFPPAERNLLSASFRLPQGTKIEHTEAVMEQVEQFILDSLMAREEQGVQRFTTFIGKGAPKFDRGYMQRENDPAYAQMLMITSSTKVNEEMIRRLNSYCYEQLPEVTAMVNRIHLSGMEHPLEIRVSGESLDRLFGISEHIKLKLDSLEGTVNVLDNWGLKTKKFVVDVDQTRARLAELTSSDIASALQTTLTGAAIGEFHEEDRTIPIVLRSPQVDQNDFHSIEGVTIFSPASREKIPLKSVANIRSDWQYAVIYRKNLYRTITITADVKGGYTAAEINKMFLPWLLKYSKDWPAGITFELGGEVEQSLESMRPIWTRLWVSLALVLILLLIEFNSFRKTLLILTTLPIGFLGVFFGLFVSNAYLGFFAFLGAVAMGGLSMNNGLILFERIEEELAKDQSLHLAILRAARQRIRSILLITVTTVCSLLPLWWHADYWMPMAVSMIFGLIFSTLYTVYLLPVFYYWTYNKKRE